MIERQIFMSSKGFMKEQGNIIFKLNICISVLLIICVFYWPYVQKGVYWYYKREANFYFDYINKIQEIYKAKNSKYLIFKKNCQELPPEINPNSSQVQKLKRDLKNTKFYNFTVVQKNSKSYQIIAQLKKKIIKKWWFFINDETQMQLIYEKKEYEQGKVI